MGEARADLWNMGRVWLFPLTYPLKNYGKRAPWHVKSQL